MPDVQQKGKIFFRRSYQGVAPISGVFIGDSVSKKNYPFQNAPL